MIGLFSKETRRKIAVTPAELRVVLWSGAFFFFVLASFSILRPVREQFGVSAGVDKLPWLFLGTWLTMLVLNPIYGAVVSRLTRRQFIPLVYRFFMLNLVVLFVLMQVLEGEAHEGLGYAFYIWVSVFNLWVVSVFWSFMADNFGSGSARRLYAWIAVGGTLGAIGGALVALHGPDGIAALLGEGATASDAVPYLLLVSVAILEGGVFCARRLMRRFDAEPDLGGAGLDARPPKLGGASVDGLFEVLRSPYLLTICLYLLCYSVTGTLLYFVQAEIVGQYAGTVAERTEAFALIDLLTQVLTLFVQLFITRRLLAAAGVGRTLGVLPIVAGVAFLAVWISPAFWTILVVQGLRRSARYAVSKPAREVLFAVLDRSEKYKAKAVIDTFVYRTGDVAGSGLKVLLGKVMPGLAPVVAVAIPLSAAWAWLSIVLGRSHAARARRDDATDPEYIPPSPGAGPAPE